MSRVLDRMAVAGLLFCWLALPAAADGLSRFEEAMKQAPAGTLTYKSAKALGDNGFVLEGVVVTPPPDKTPGAKAEPVEIKRIAVEDFDFASVDKKAPPNFARVRVEGIVIGAKPAEGIDLAELAGIDKITADFQLDYRLDPDRKTMTLNRLELDLNGLARLFEDRSLLSKVLPAAAKMQGIEPVALVVMSKALLAGLRAGQGNATLAALDALGSYLDDYQQPKGPLRVTLNPPEKTSAAALSAMTTPDEAITALGLVVSYAGTKPQAPAAKSDTTASASAPGKPGGKAGCAPGARFFVMHEEAWWSVTAREASKSGDRCIARIDGGTDDDITFALDQTLAWSIDGPGKPVAKCSSGDKVVVAYKDGGWYAAKVTGNAAAGAKCPIKYDSDDSKEQRRQQGNRRTEADAAA